MALSRFVGAIALSVCALSGSSFAQGTGQYIFTARIFAGVDGSDLLAAPTFRVRVGQPGTWSLSPKDSSHQLRLDITPTDAGSGKVALHVVVTLDRAGALSTAEFDLLSGADTQAPVVAVEDKSGKPLVLGDGRPFFLQVESPAK
jgi:hypothetical protein